jgi:dipeptidyl aminopeptidase/acylaminoacyl peptidase
LLLCALCLALFLGTSSGRASVPLEVFAEPPAMSFPTLSPSGHHLAYIKASKGQLSVVICELQTDGGCRNQQVQNLQDVAVRTLRWANDDRLLLSVVVTKKINKEMTDISRVLAIGRDLSNPVILMRGSSQIWRYYNLADIVDLLPKSKDYILMSAPFRRTGRATTHNLYKVNLTTGKMSLVYKGSSNTASWMTDLNGVPRIRWDYDEERNALELYVREGNSDDWNKVGEFNEREIPDLDFIGLTERPDTAIVVSRQASDRAGLFEFNLLSKQLGKSLYQHTEVDVGQPVRRSMRDEHTGRVVSVFYADHDRVRTKYLDPELEKIQSEIDAKLSEASERILMAWSRDRTKVIVMTSGPTDPGTYYLYQRSTGSLAEFGKAHPGVTSGQLAQTRRADYVARDGLKIPAYLTLPAGASAGKLPLVIVPHGGPWARDYIEFDWWIQAMASRGYAVLQMNFRGSDGYGREYERRGFREWGLKMQDDISDGLKKVTADGIADPNRVCIVGWSYGGYAALAGGALTPDLYKCVASMAGVSDLMELLDHEKEKRGSDSLIYKTLVQRIGDPRADKDRLVSTSPARLASRFAAPVLLMHGTDDETTPIAQSQLMQNALSVAGKQVKFVEFEGEEHSLEDPASRLRFLRELESFLAAHIGATPTN